MIYNLPELDRMSRALSRLETALLTKRTVLSASQNAINDIRSNGDAPIDLIQENQMLRLQCQEMRQQLQQTHLLLAELLGHEVNIDEGGISTENKLESASAFADKLRLDDLRNDNEEEHNG
ncbi:MAG: hypothetical protein K0U39_07715 [Alphaproteobacteria bacterium]|nr:hypothetical protein [Alphaproteobacteria bacterium]